jgi:hypothetical protein
MLNLVFLHHPHSPYLIKKFDFRSNRIKQLHLSCGYTNSKKSSLRECDLFPNYASYNSILFETSCILSVWEHLPEMFPTGNIAFLHTDVIRRFNFLEILNRMPGNDEFAFGLTIPESHTEFVKSFEIENEDNYRYSLDPWHASKFDGVVDILELLRIIDAESWEFANDTNPIMIYGHQFAVSRRIFEEVAYEIAGIVNNLRLGQCGIWTPHVFERIWAIRLAMKVRPTLFSPLIHKLNSGSTKSSNQNYGIRSFKYLKMRSRIYDHFEY